jgi:hypothetical protein
MSFLCSPPFTQPSGSNICPQCQAAGVTDCPHGSKVETKPSDPRIDNGPAASAVLLKAAFLGAIGALGYFVWRSGKPRTEGNESEAPPETPFEEWMPNQ